MHTTYSITDVNYAIKRSSASYFKICKTIHTGDPLEGKVNGEIRVTFTPQL